MGDLNTITGTANGPKGEDRGPLGSHPPHKAIWQPSRGHGEGNRPDCAAIQAVVVPGPQADNTPTAEQVAEVVAGISAIGAARDALEKAGWHATIAGNRITVNHEVCVQFIGSSVGPVGVVYATRPITATSVATQPIHTP